jgi:two-component system, sensor histidine kinase and response regulator
MARQDTLPRLLIVDDEPSNLILLQRVFQKHYDVTCAESGKEALSILDHSHMDIVLLDIMMPQVTGIQVLQTIRSQPELIELPVVLVSALSDGRDVAEGLRLGANDYVTKPIDIDVMFARVQTQMTLKRLRDERKEAYEELEAAQTMRERFFRIASHDLKGPLGNISMAQFLLRKTVGNDPDALSLLDMVSETVDTMKTVIDEFLSFAALQSGKIEMNIGSVSVDWMLSDLVKKYNLNASGKGIVVELGVTPGVVCVDSERFMQAMSNLISNAIKYSPQNSVVSVWSEEHDGFVRICVADQGPGIPANEREKLFTEFGKLSTRPTGGESSTGLGLWIVKHLIELQNGRVDVECPPEGGSIFYIDLPAVEMAITA